MNQNNEPKDCLKCPRRGTSKCAFLNRDYNAKCSCLFVHSLDIDNKVDKMVQSLQARLEAISNTLQVPMDYNRDDTQDIAQRFCPNIN